MESRRLVPGVGIAHIVADRFNKCSNGGVQDSELFMQCAADTRFRFRRYSDLKKRAGPMAVTHLPAFTSAHANRLIAFGGQRLALPCSSGRHRRTDRLCDVNPPCGRQLLLFQQTHEKRTETPRMLAARWLVSSWLSATMETNLPASTLRAFSTIRVRTGAGIDAGASYRHGRLY